ncbi:MAG TPA: hypothetical protein ENJ95_23325 [Bacteroidetes bacterium]|nr:hypothetical protein [Bacteroidota bacterium]
MDNIKTTIQKGEIEEALNKLIIQFHNSEHEKDLIILSSQNHANQRNKRLGIVSFENYNLERNKIVFNLLQLTDLLQKGKKGEKGFGKTQNKKRKVIICESNPLGQNLFSNVEIREIEEIIFNNTSNLDLIIKMGLNINYFIDSINQHQAQIIHFTAFANILNHNRFCASSAGSPLLGLGAGEGKCTKPIMVQYNEGIYFHDQSDKPVQIGNDSFLKYFEMIDKGVECLFFNTFISENLAKNISLENIFVVGFNDIVNSYAAIEFATGFYKAIGYGKDYLTAYDIGRQTLLNGVHKDIVLKLYAYADGQKIIFT